VEQLALQQQIDALQQQQQQIAATHQQYVNMGMISPQQQLQANNFMGSPTQMQYMQGAQAFQFPGQQMTQQQLGLAQQQQQQAHRRNQSAVGNMGMGPPPAPSSGSAGTFGNFNQENANPRKGSIGGGHGRRHSLALPEAKKAAEAAEAKRRTSGFQFPIPGATGATGAPPTTSSIEPPSPRAMSPSQQESQSATSIRGLGVQAARAGAHGRSQSMAVGSAGRGPVQGMNPTSNFRFPGTVDQASENSPRRGSIGQGHNRAGSRNFDNWRQPSISQSSLGGEQQQMGSFSMSQGANHRARGSVSHQSIGSMSNFQFPGQPQIIQLPQGPMLVQQPQMYNGQSLAPINGGFTSLQIAQLQALQQAQAAGQLPVLAPGQQTLTAAQQQQQRKTLFTPYLPQATLPALLSDGQLVSGILRVNKKNRSDAYVTSTDLDADIFICGSKDRNRALEGDYVAVELLDVDEVWGQKREKEEKKKRKDMNDNRNGSIAVNDATTGSDTGSNADGGLRRRGSLRQRPTQKKNDDVEVEGQSLLLMEEEEINDDQKPLYAGHIVAVVERNAGQMFSGSLGLLRPSSQATKDKQDAERSARDPGGRQHDRPQDKPKIVWFKPTDKRVPLIAIPTEQAPRDFVERHQEYANRIFVACIKRWPITSLHPFGTLVEQLGEAGDLKVETDALLRDNNFGPDEFSDAVLRSVGHDDWSVENDGEQALESRRDLREEETFTIDPNGAKELDDALHIKTLEDGRIEVGIHVADVAHFIKANSLVDREAKKRGTAVFLMNRTVDMLPPRISEEVCCLKPDEERYTVSVIFKVDATTGEVDEDETWVGKTVIKSNGKLSYDEVDAVINGSGASEVDAARVEQIRNLHKITQKFRQARFGDRVDDVPALRLLYQLDDENVPVEHNLFNSSPTHELIEELGHKANTAVAGLIFSRFGEKAWLRRHASPNPRRLETFADRMSRIGYSIDTTSSGSLQNSLFSIEDADVRKGMETLLIKTMQRAKYAVANKTAIEDLAHFSLNLPIYTHFTSPTRRYGDIIVHRQLEAILSGDVSQFSDDIDSLVKTAEQCNTKKDSAQSAQEQSVHIESCRRIDKLIKAAGGEMICEGIVISVYESAFDVVIPEYGFEKRVHCDQLPLKKAEFDNNKRVLELYWEKGVSSTTFVPEDEKSSSRSGMKDLVRSTAGVSIKDGGKSADDKAANKEKYLSWVTLREERNNYIQDVTEMKRVPVLLQTDLTKSPPYVFCIQVYLLLC
jgi:protein SSD1